MVTKRRRDWLMYAAFIGLVPGIVILLAGYRWGAIPAAGGLLAMIAYNVVANRPENRIRRPGMGPDD